MWILWLHKGLFWPVSPTKHMFKSDSVGVYIRYKSDHYGFPRTISWIVQRPTEAMVQIFWWLWKLHGFDNCYSSYNILDYFGKPTTARFLQEHFFSKCSTGLEILGHNYTGVCYCFHDSKIWWLKVILAVTVECIASNQYVD